MIDFNVLAEAMGDLDEDVMTEMLQQVMEEGGQKRRKPWKHARREWIL